MFFRKILIIFILSSVLMQSHSVSAKSKRFRDLELFNKVLYLIESQYYRKIDFQRLIEGALNGMMSTLDPHSMYLNKKVFKKMQEDTNGEFGGLGIEVTQKDGIITVITPIEDSPAYKAGVQAGDKLVEINHSSTVGLTLENAISLMNEKKRKKVVLGIIREGQESMIIKEVRRAIVKINPVKSKLIDKKFIYLRLKQFQKGSGTAISRDLFLLMKKSKRLGEIPKGIILDLRNNPGGLLDEAVNVASIFLKSGVVVSTESRDPKNKEIRYVKKIGKKETSLPMIVLINSSSASASEIVTGALKDHKRALIMGITSFGKGSVQTIAKISKNQGLKLTIAQYMTPSGKKIQAIGIKPDIELQTFEGKWSEEHQGIDTSIRESDLKNHLNATIESKEEKKNRLIKERIARKKRVDKYKLWKKSKSLSKSKKIKSLKSNLKLENDYWVVLAKRQLKTISMYLKINK